MSHILINAKHVQRKFVDDVTTVGDGSHFVDDGVLAIEATTGNALIFERSNWDEQHHAADPRLKLELRLFQIGFRKTRSSQYNHEAGVMTITGTFDRIKPETFTIKMERNDAELVRELLMRLNF